MHRDGGHPISFHSAIDPAVFDAESLAVLQRLMPPERVRCYLQDLDQQLRLMIATPPDSPALQGQAHNVVSQAGMLGLTRMCESARALEEACRSGAGQVAALHRCRAAAGDVRQYAMRAAEQWPETPGRRSTLSWYLEAGLQALLRYLEASL